MKLQKNHKILPKYHKNVTRSRYLVLSARRDYLAGRPGKGLTGRYIADNIERLELYQNGQKKDDGNQDTGIRRQARGTLRASAG
ncbi:MAG: hypothetical protein KAW90_04445, partial [Dehalococcoidales bacterium]|nr:hypothetical protein [Dehalococcoidales bacterium]